MQTLHFSITINTPVEKVRKIMLDHPTYEAWTSAFCEGSTYTGSWEQGTEINFVDPAGYGMIAQVVQNRPYEYISLHHFKELRKNEETGEIESVSIKRDSYENYSFSVVDQQTTTVAVEQTNMPDEYVDMFNGLRPKALQLLKELCEK